MTDTNLPEVGSIRVHKRDGDITVTAVKKRGRGYYVLYSVFSGEERRARLKDFWKAVVA